MVALVLGVVLNLINQATTGTVQYAPDKSAFVWKIKQLGGGRDFLMRAHFGLPSVKSGTLAFLFTSF